MRAFFIAAIAAVFLAMLPAHARLGETEDQCIARYGPVLKRGTSYTTGKPLPALVFIKNDYLFYAILLDGKVGFLSLQKTDKSELSDNEINTFLDANSENQKWTSHGVISGIEAWFRDDGSQAQYDPADHSLCLILKAYGDAQTAAEKAAEDQKLKGF